MPAFTSNLNLYKPGGGSTGLITPDEVVDVDRFNQNLDLLDAFAGGVNSDIQEILKKGRTAKVVKTNNFQAIPTTGAVVTGMTSQILHAGYSWDSPNNTLTVTEAGTYLITVIVYGSGSQLDQITLGFNDTATNGIDSAVPSVNLKRTDAAVDGRNSLSAPCVFSAGRKLRLVAVSSAGSPSIYGGPAGDATGFSVVRLGPSSM